ncbi:MAG: efflux transporter outer membrane subunit [Telmatospirillum sp.]|nr:efflux transporter outer membrane subunit [Telmatospirillum sp.]
MWGPARRTAISRLRRSAGALAIGTVILSLAGCVRPDGLEHAGRMIGADSLAAGDSLPREKGNRVPWPVADWWRGLGAPQLARLIDEGLEGTPDLAAADARAAQAGAAVPSADASRGPALDGTGRVAAYRRSRAGDGPWSNGNDTAVTREAGLELSWTLALWGAGRSAWEAAGGRARAAEIDGRAARIELSVAIARAYARLGYACARHDVARADLVRARAVLDLTRQKAQSGIEDQRQVRRAEGDVADAERQAETMDQTIRSTRIALAVLLGKGPDRGRDIERPRILSPRSVAVPADLPGGLLGHRADLVAARWRVEAAGRDIAAARTAFLPNVSISGLAGLSSLDAASPVALSALTGRFGPAVSLPLFDGGRRRAGLSDRDAAYDLAVAHYNKTLVAAVNAVAERLSGLRSMETQAEAQRRAVDAATADSALSLARYREGIGSDLEALSVRRHLLGAEDRMAALDAGRVDLSLQLIEALGGGYQPDPQDRPAAAEATPQP